jgi:hypothetical protein
MTGWNWTCRLLRRTRRAEPAVTAWRPEGRTIARPSRLARSVPPLRGYGLDRLSPDRQAARKRSRFKVSGAAPFATPEPKQSSRMLWRRQGSFRQNRVGATLMACPTFAYRVVPEPKPAPCPTTSTSFPVRGRASADRPNTMSRRGAWRTIGPRAYRSRTPRSTYSRRGSAIFSMNCSGRAFEVRRHLP